MMQRLFDVRKIIRRLIVRRDPRCSPRVLAVALLLFATFAAPRLALACDVWERAEPLEVGNQLHDVDHFNGLWVAVGQGGTIMTSADGTTWVRRESGVFEDLLQVAGGPERWVAMGEGGVLLASEDGGAWHQTGHSCPGSVYEAVWAGSRFVAVGEGYNGEGYVALTSSDGLVWAISHVFEGYRQVYDLEWTGSRLMGVGQGYGGDAVVVASTDGATWEDVGDPGAKYFRDVAWNGQTLVATCWRSSIKWSEDGGATWRVASIPSPYIYFYDLLWTGNEFLAVGRYLDPFSWRWGDTRVYRSQDGKVWDELTVATGWLIFAGAGSAGLGVLLGEWGLIETWSDPEGWITAEAGTITGLHAVASSGTVFVAVGTEGFVATSTDGHTWSPQELAGGETLADVIWVQSWPGGSPGEGRFVAVGWRGQPAQAVVADSSDGVSWTVQDVAVARELTLWGVVWTGDGLVAVGEDHETDTFVSLTSTDGGAWSYHATEHRTVCYQRLAWNGTAFIAANYVYGLLSSNDGINWIDATPAIDYFWPEFYDVATHSNEFVVVGSFYDDGDWPGLILTSSDGADWTVIGEHLNSRPVTLEWIGDRFLAVGGIGTTRWGGLGPGTQVVSFLSDGTIFWPDVSSLRGGALQGVAVSGGRAVAVDYYGRNGHADLTATPVGPTITGPQSLCSGATATFGAENGFAAYQWLEYIKGPVDEFVTRYSDIGESSPTITVSPADATTGYRVTVTDADGCSATSPMHTVTVLPVLEPVISGPTGVCAGGSAVLDAGAGYASYLWSTGEDTQTISVAPSEATAYTVAVTADEGCPGTSAEHTVEVYSLPQPAIDGPRRICFGDSALLDAGEGYASYLWSTGDTTRQITVTPGETTAYTVAVTSAQGCPGTSAEHVLAVGSCEPLVFADGFESGTVGMW